MPGITSTAELFRRASATIIDQLAERNEESGELVTLTYHPPGKTGVKWPCVLGSIRFESIDPVTGELERRERRQVEIDSATMATDGVTNFQFAAVVELPDGTRWEVDENESVFGDPAMNTLSLVRTPLVRMNEVRRAAV